jgi:hypothetical protein
MPSDPITSVSPRLSWVTPTMTNTKFIDMVPETDGSETFIPEAIKAITQ